MDFHQNIFFDNLKGLLKMRKNNETCPKITVHAMHSRSRKGHVRQRSNGRWEGQYYFKGERKSNN